MSIVAAFSGTFCRAEKILEKFSAESGYELLTDEQIMKRAAELSNIPFETMNRCFSSKASVFNPFTRERERSLAWLRLAVAEACQKETVVLHGFSSHLIPASISHVLRVCLIAEMPFRVRTARKVSDRSKESLSEQLAGQDQERTAWVRTVRNHSDPWDPELYDMVLPTHDRDIVESAALIRQALAAKAVKPSPASRRMAKFFLKEAGVEAELAAQGHVAAVSMDGDDVILTIDRPVLMRDRLESELIDVVRTVHAGGNIEVRIEPAGESREVYRVYSPETPSRVLLVDDEREFVQTLSERLEMRNIGAAVAYDGESALEMVEDDAPEVMLLDLQMPGINGIEVLKQVKNERPEIEVVILTGHGTNKDRDLCLELGAFAYLEKPVDIDVLSDTLKQANEKMRQNLKPDYLKK